ncbi:MAG: hypothetical protein PHD71_07560 [Methanospirillum sp.]|nr:hypothetical protein [Methanospirillum sp.]
MLRETVINALVHADYSQKRAVVREKVLGNPHVSSISTSVVEGYNN